MTKITFRHLKSFPIIFISFFLVCANANSAMQDFETTRLKSTAGAGVGSILMDEATILNPAPIAFFDIGSIYLNKGVSEQTTSLGSPQGDVDHMGVIVSDSKSSTAGSVSYQVQKIGEQKKTLLAAAMASPIKERSAMGVSLRRTSEVSSNGVETNYLQTVMGITHVVNQNFTIGFVAVDPFKERVSDSIGVFGTQYVFKEFISLMVDVGANYYEKLNDSFLHRSAVQFKLLDDFYARFGFFRDLGQKMKGTGVGLGWVQPRLALEGALKNTETFSGDEITESSFSLSYRF